ncbi:MucB/RseB-like sigma(E) regulatory protein [Orenia metallireducens]|uniref:Sigma E regulatory protein, MucB/RseB n=1 Tax=Orenia metallireducens TaxID=1413210 RepID=A0A285F551_9FIRM|nr:outer membrane lipoprotein-sorting protein [Orenia metallireducens]PRX34757.1 MucB/RseB-like sigma(E) regulatory protein [Orenia metallireducens]SNY05506.1 sigma E regulatory protein, MucB/RseB [Orenia metallireducens]
MSRFKILLVTLLTSLVLLSNLAFAMTAEEIMNQVDEYHHLKSAKVESEMIITKGNRKLVKKMSSLIKGSKLGMTEFTNPRDRGSKFLKRGDDLWMFFPDAEDIVKISGHMLEQGMMGSDFSYKDMMESAKLTDLYDFKILGEKEYQGRSCYLIEGIKKEGKDASYYRRVDWVDKERYVPLKEELYAQSGRLLKIMETKKVDKIDGRWFATHQVIDNKLKRGTETEYRVNSIEFDADIPDNSFSLRNLRR